MSRAYKIKASESSSRIIRASDHVSTQMEILEILSCEEMAGILKNELLNEGFETTPEGLLARKTNNITITVDPFNAEVVVRAEDESQVDVSATQDGNVYDEESREARAEKQAALEKKVREDLDAQTEEKTTQLQQELTDQLEDALLDVQKELGRVVNRATAAALKIKAARLGEIKEMTEDPESGSLTIVVEV